MPALDQFDVQIKEADEHLGILLNKDKTMTLSPSKMDMSQRESFMQFKPEPGNAKSSVIEKSRTGPVA